MSIRKLIRHKVVISSTDMPISEAAKLMKENNIGDIIVVENNNEPIGIITDRDITIKIVADEVNPNQMTASDIMSTDLLVLKEHQSIQEALEMMCAKGVRRAPIVNDKNYLTGIISADDLVLLLSDELESYGKLIRKQLSTMNK